MSKDRARIYKTMSKAKRKPTQKQVDYLNSIECEYNVDELTKEKAQIIMSFYKNINDLSFTKLKKKKKELKSQLDRIDKKNLRLKKELDLQIFADNLNENMPKSEAWFLTELEKKKIKLNFEQNKTLNGYIPDFIIEKYKIVIEIDGSIHLREDIKKKDLIKDRTYIKLGYEVIRIVAYDKKSFNKGIARILKTIRKRSQSLSKQKEAKQRRKKYLDRVKPISKSKLSLESCQVCKEQKGTNLVDVKEKTFRVCNNCKPSIRV